MAFNERLRELRTERGLTQTEISEILNVKQNTYCYWELGKSEPDIEMLKKISDFFRVSLDYLTGRH